MKPNPSFVTLPDGRRLAYERYGDPNGTPAFFFHGWPSSRIQGLLMDAPGKELGLNVVAMDRPGIGQSDPQPGRRLRDWPQLLTVLADHLGWEKFHLFGVSGGGPYVLATCHGIPDRVLSASVICGAPPLRMFGTRDLFWPYRLVTALKKSCPTLLHPAFYVGLKMSYLSPKQFPLNLLVRSLTPEDQRALREATTLQTVVESYREAVRSGVANLETDGDVYLEDWGLDFSQIIHPLQIWHGQKDRNIPYAYAQKVAALLPHATTHWTPEDGHYSLPALRIREIARVALGLS